MRTFVALELPDAFAHEVAGLARQLSSLVEGRFVPAENHHVTLAFLGEVGEAEAASAVEALEAACAGCGPICLASDGLGIFGRARNATLWLGVRGSGLRELRELVCAGLATQGLAYDDKPFRPHVTIARHARVEEGAFDALAFPDSDEATRVTLFRSILSSEGSVYKPLHTVRLGG